MKTYQITEKDLTSFEAWLEIYLRKSLPKASACNKIDVVNTFKETYATEIIDSKKNQNSQEGNIIKALNKIFSILYGLIYPEIPNDKCTCLDDPQEILKTIEEGA